LTLTVAGSPRRQQGQARILSTPLDTPAHPDTSRGARTHPPRDAFYCRVLSVVEPPLGIGAAPLGIGVALPPWGTGSIVIFSRRMPPPSTLPEVVPSPRMRA
jgi:hypothetical protein